VPDGDTARALLAGWVSGAAVAFAHTLLLLLALARDPRWRERFGRTRLRLPLVGVVVVNAMMLFWTVAGLILGAIYPGAEQPAFSITVGAILISGVVLFAVIRGMPGWLTWSTVAVAVVAFGGMLPTLAELG
jgi:sterol desaturase/sphingolipid hydroxylase (fatty acid hydroxylase superfamily)